MLTNRQQNVMFIVMFIAFIIVLFIQVRNPSACFTSC